MKYEIAVDRCPHGTNAISLDSDGGGTRLLGPKHCGRWERQFAFTLTPENARAMIRELEDAIEDMEKEPTHE